MYVLLEVVCLLMVGLYGQSNGKDVVEINLSQSAPSSVLPSPGSEPDFTWNVTAPTGFKILLNCPHLSLPKSDSCSSGSLTIDDRMTARRLCDDMSNYELQSIGSKMTLRLQRKEGVEGTFECTVQLSSTDPAPVSHGARPAKNSYQCGWRVRQLDIERKVFLTIIVRRSTGTVFFGGSIITERHILTLDFPLSGWPGSDFDVHLGKFTKAVGTQSLPVRCLYSSPSYRDSYRPAVLELTEAIQFSPYVGPICLASKSYSLRGKDLIAFARNGEWNTRGTIVTTETINTMLKESGGKTFETWAKRKYMFQGVPLLYFDREMGGYVQVGIQAYMGGNGYLHTNITTYFTWIEEILRGGPSIEKYIVKWNTNG